MKILEQHQVSSDHNYEQQKQEALAELDAQLRSMISKAEAQKQIALDEAMLNKKALLQAESQVCFCH